MALEAETEEKMRQLARLAFTGEEPAAIDASRERLAVYHDLVSHVFSDTLQQAFPLASAALGPQWLSLTKAFIQSGPKTSPQLWRMPKEFADFVRASAFPQTLDCPWLMNLLDFEWMEIELYMMPDSEARQDIEPSPSIDSGAIVMNPDYRVASFEFPVFRTLDREQLSERGCHFLLGFRHRESGKVHFASLTAAMVLVIESLAAGPQPLQQIFRHLEGIAANPPIMIDHGAIRRQLNELATAGLILGVMKEG